MKVQNISHQQFKGYSNILCYNEGDGVTRNLFLAAKLNNNDGYNDLDKFRKFRELYPMANINAGNDVLVMFYNRISPSEDYLYINEEPLFLGEDLKSLEDSVSHKEFKGIETINMKAYTLLGQLTTRIMNSKEPPVYKHVHEVINVCRRTLCKLSNDEDLAENLVKRAVKSTFKNPISVKRNAKYLNRIVDESMRAFFMTHIV